VRMENYFLYPRIIDRLSEPRARARARLQPCLHIFEGTSAFGLPRGSNRDYRHCVPINRGIPRPSDEQINKLDCQCDDPSVIARTVNLSNSAAIGRFISDR